ncbi:hypothetical protein PROFUN_11577 [Planoprotostelium fungivorum]|uniref:Cyanocobalamin reductase (cyanide-eliminating) n=1 Tax=Planoprotostelium fungivorum TaxID=1890364 RepID=A0A2P6N9R7_9EUKA|nr:hypothetical protein PROFUN_11577 [Planoprotostelium fungivorum]
MSREGCSEQKDLVASFREAMSEEGFDICNPFRVSAYNELVRDRHRFNGSSVDCLGFLIGNTKSSWPHFVSYLQRVGMIKDPVEHFCREAVAGVTSQKRFSSLNPEVRFDFDTPSSGKFVHIQTAGHVSGTAYYDKETFWSIHPHYGVWFVYRAVVFFPTITYLLEDPILPVNLFTPEECKEIGRLTEKAQMERWRDMRTRLLIRDVCPIGKDKWRYEGDQLDYFYPIERTKEEVLRDLLDRETEQQGNRRDE